MGLNVNLMLGKEYGEGRVIWKVVVMAVGIIGFQCTCVPVMRGHTKCRIEQSKHIVLAEMWSDAAHNIC